MEYKVNAMVQYSAAGICKIVRTEKKQILQQEKEYYVLQPMFEKNSTIYVPTDNADLLSKMRPVLNAEEIHALIQSIRDDEDIWIEDKQERQTAFRSLLQRGDRAEIIKLIKAMYLQEKELHAKGKKLHIADEKMYKIAQKVLYDEFAFVLDIQPSEVVPMIMQALEPEVSK
ncbi:MAG: CarD family transcriptional regulator [Clostridia bacterium]|nr:CarD family transcriptional regulator [Clostridia bacterium]